MMAEAEKFTYHAGNIHELPLDKSLNMIQKELCSEYPDAQTQGFSRKMIQCAVRDLSVSEDRIPISRSVPNTQYISICSASTLIPKIQIVETIPTRLQ